MSRVIAIVGRPNVGKSALFNRLAGKRIAIVHDQPGVTRDRVSAEAEWRGQPFTLVDTGGMGLLRGQKANDAITEAAFNQVQIAIDSADLILFVVNVREGIVPLDREVAQRLRQSGKPVAVVVNKADHARAESATPEFAELGFEDLFAVSAIHGGGIETLIDYAVGKLPPLPESPAQPESDPSALKLAIVGRPNVGKSSIINALTRSERVIVTAVPGTTRDAIDVPFEVDTEGVRERFILIDTAGMRKARRVNDSVEFFSVQRTEDSIARCDIVVLVMDAGAGITEQEKKIGDLIVENRKACILVVNKWDLVSEEVRRSREAEILRRDGREQKGKPKVMTTLSEFAEWVQGQLFFLDYAPVIFTSAQTGFQLDRFLEAVRYVGAQLLQKIPTAVLNRTLQDAVEKRQPISDRGHFLKFFYATQTRQAPPTFILFVNRHELLSDGYRKYLSRELRRAFGYEGCPIVLNARARPKTVESKRKPQARRPTTQNRRPTGKRRLFGAKRHAPRAKR